MSATTTPTAPAAQLAPINAYFAILLWYATGQNGLVQITRVPKSAATALSVPDGSPALASLATNFSALADAPDVAAMLAKFEAAIQHGFSTNQYYVQDAAAAAGAPPTKAGKINYGAALSVVGELFTTLRTTNAFGLDPEDDYNAGDPSCCMNQLMAVIKAPPVTSASALARAAVVAPPEVDQSE